ncbi:MAG: hormogonium polysaccharide secretion pseudopilin HpsB [Cyanobacteria bacterium SBLK]|nr:hormogonium polysaccharide secretion pseudopilin HpsB [Cyanobacteria bacterium SBLK]
MKLNPSSITSNSREAGFTIIESLLAVIVVGILIVAIGPVIALSAATRIQARRTEWSTQAARSYLDGLRGGAIAPPPIDGLNNPTDKKAYTDYLTGLPAPASNTLTCNARTQATLAVGDTGSGYCTAPAPGTQSAVYCVDGDNDNTCTAGSMRDFVVQAAGVQKDTGLVDNSERAKRGYLLGIRVYRADGFGDADQLKTQEPAKSFAGGLGDKKAPMLITITEVIGSDTTYQNLQNQYQ